jgi:hypothetical protein
MVSLIDSFIQSQSRIIVSEGKGLTLTNLNLKMRMIMLNKEIEKINDLRDLSENPVSDEEFWKMSVGERLEELFKIYTSLRTSEYDGKYETSIVEDSYLPNEFRKLSTHFANTFENFIGDFLSAMGRLKTEQEYRWVVMNKPDLIDKDLMLRTVNYRTMAKELTSGNFYFSH